MFSFRVFCVSNLLLKLHIRPLSGRASGTVEAVSSTMQKPGSRRGMELQRANPRFVWVGLGSSRWKLLEFDLDGVPDNRC